MAKLGVAVVHSQVVIVEIVIPAMVGIVNQNVNLPILVVMEMGIAYLVLAIHRAMLLKIYAVYQTQ
jgi:hypothetical protein